MHEVAGLGDGTAAAGLRAIEPQLTYGFRKTFEALDRYTDELRRDRSRTKLAQCVTLYHVIVEATLAQPGQHFIEDYLVRRDAPPRLPLRHAQRRARRAAPHRLRREAARRPAPPRTRRCPTRWPTCCATCCPPAPACWCRPAGTARYTECFGFTLEEIYAEAGRSFETKLRSAGMPVDELPGPIPYPFDLTPDERAKRMVTLLQGGIIGEGTGAAARDPETMAALFDSLRRGVDHRTAPAGPAHAAVGLPRRRALAPAAWTTAARRRGRASRPTPT